jgi:FlaA1/EpsC-like NDP-sugar epimerase
MKGLIKRYRNRFAAVLYDLAVIPIAWVGSYWVRFNMGSIPDPFIGTVLKTLPLVLVVQASLFWFFGLYRGVWRFASLPDLFRIIKSVVSGIVCIGVVLFFVNRLEGVPRSVLPIYGLLLAVLLGTARVAVRWVKDQHLYTGKGDRVLIIGAGRAGEMLVREMRRSGGGQYFPIGFVDDDIKHHGREIQGVRVLGGCDRLVELAAEHEADVIIIAIPSGSGTEMRRIVELCERTGVPFRTLPAMDSVMSGSIGLQELREVLIEDLLGREPISLDWSGINRGVAGKTVLVTGGGGSIGGELCRQISRTKPRKIVIFEKSEFNLYKIERELKEEFDGLQITAVLGDVTDRCAVEHCIKSYMPELVFHAAAYKHVPMLEGQVREAAKNNVIGTRIVAEAARLAGCEAFVLISTDKAVNPANVMGATKRMAEIICQDLSQRSKTKYITVRFGNVLGSAGSVVPLFKEQLKNGGPLTVTHPEITRYFMTIPEACQLILQAAVIGKGGEIFVLDMGEPVRIIYLAEQLIRLSGKEPGKDIDIEITGLRPGEKLYEELFHEQEPLAPTVHKKILLAQHRNVKWFDLAGVLDGLEGDCEAYTEESLIERIRVLVPELRSSSPAFGPGELDVEKGQAG